MANTSDDDALLWGDFDIEYWYSVPTDQSSRLQNHLPEDVGDESEAI